VPQSVHSHSPLLVLSLRQHHSSSVSPFKQTTQTCSHRPLNCSTSLSASASCATPHCCGHHQLTTTLTFSPPTAHHLHSRLSLLHLSPWAATRPSRRFRHRSPSRTSTLPRSCTLRSHTRPSSPLAVKTTLADRVLAATC
jgi:hypothetical protein